MAKFFTVKFSSTQHGGFYEKIKKYIMINRQHGPHNTVPGDNTVKIQRQTQHGQTQHGQNTTRLKHNTVKNTATNIFTKHNTVKILHSEYK